jgi:hypothetical protein
MLPILKGFVADAEIPPAELLVLPPLADISGLPYKYRVLGGFHAFIRRVRFPVSANSQI